MVFWQRIVFKNVTALEAKKAEIFTKLRQSVLSYTHCIVLEYNLLNTSRYIKMSMPGVLFYVEISQPKIKFGASIIHQPSKSSPTSDNVKLLSHSDATTFIQIKALKQTLLWSYSASDTFLWRLHGKIYITQTGKIIRIGSMQRKYGVLRVWNQDIPILSSKSDACLSPSKFLQLCPKCIYCIFSGTSSHVELLPSSLPHTSFSVKIWPSHRKVHLHISYN